MKLHLAILVRQPLVNQYVRDLILKIKEEPGISLDCLLISEDSKSEKNNLSFVKIGLFKLILLIERIILFRNVHIVKHIIKSFDIREHFESVIELSQAELLSGEGPGQQRHPALPESNFDLILKIGNEPDSMSGFIKYSNLGMVSAAFSGDVKNENLLSGFWEVFYQADTTNFTVSQVFESRAKKILLQCSFQTRYCFLLNKAFLYKKAGVHLLKFIKQISLTRTLPQNMRISQSFTKSSELYKIGLSTFVSYIFRTLIIVCKKISRIVFFDGFRWHVVIYNKNFKSSMVREPRIVTNPSKRFLADPFLIENDGKTFCFVEDCDVKTKKGKISYFEVFENSFSEIKPCLTEDCHLSFPFVFKYSSEIYMCPETCDMSQIRVYKAVDFPREWKLETVLMDDVRAADTMLFAASGKWWMLTNIDPAKIGDNSSELYLFYSDSPLSRDWTPHPLNPIYVNSTKARNGGIIIVGDEVYRIAQRQAFDKYGANISVYRIIDLSETTYREHLLQTIDPNYLPNILGTHHLSAAGDFTALDFYNVE